MGQPGILTDDMLWEYTHPSGSCHTRSKLEGEHQRVGLTESKTCVLLQLVFWMFAKRNIVH